MYSNLYNFDECIVEKNVLGKSYTYLTSILKYCNFPLEHHHQFKFQKKKFFTEHAFLYAHMINNQINVLSLL